jgi:hypothetical protein
MSFLDESEHRMEWADIVGYVMDGLFMIDLVLSYFSAYYDNNLNLITDRKVSQVHPENRS